MDSDLCASGPSDSRPPVAPGTGNFNVTVTLTPASPTAVCAATRTLVSGSAAYAASFWARGYATLLTLGACFSIEHVTPSPSPRNAVLIAQFDNFVTALVRGGFLSPADGATLAAEAGAL